MFIHEYGHYFIARLNGVDVEKFSIGFGPVLFKKIDKNNTIWQICALPLGGYVKFSGEMYSNNKKKDNNVILANLINIQLILVYTFRQHRIHNLA